MASDYDLATPQEMASIDFARDNFVVFNRYIELRLHGVYSVTAFRRSFPPQYAGDHSLMLRMADAVEFNPYVISKLRDRISEVPATDLWNAKIAIHEFVSLARDPTAKDTARLGAMKELNILCQITVIDENGKTRLGSSLDDFYRDVDSKKSVVVNSQQNSAPAIGTERVENDHDRDKSEAHG